MTDKITAYTDGSAVANGKNKGKGGFGVYFPDMEGVPRAFSLGFKQAKTGQMEVMALLHAIINLPKLSEPTLLIVYSDSEYVVKTFTENRLQKWVANNWINSSGKVKNRDLWENILNALSKKRFLKLELRHIKSHQVEKEKDPEKKKLLMQDPHIKGNMIADKLADYKRHKELL